jgi:hypothetical protein
MAGHHGPAHIVAQRLLKVKAVVSPVERGLAVCGGLALFIAGAVIACVHRIKVLLLLLLQPRLLGLAAHRTPERVDAIRVKVSEVDARRAARVHARKGWLMAMLMVRGWRGGLRVVRVGVDGIREVRAQLLCAALWAWQLWHVLLGGLVGVCSLGSGGHGRDQGATKSGCLQCGEIMRLAIYDRQGVAVEKLGLDRRAAVSAYARKVTLALRMEDEHAASDGTAVSEVCRRTGCVKLMTKRHWP